MIDAESLDLIPNSRAEKPGAEENSSCNVRCVWSGSEPRSHDEAVLQIKQLADKIPMDKSVKGFLYSISSGDHRYRTALSSLIWARSLPEHAYEPKRDYLGKSTCKVCEMPISAESGNTDFDMEKYKQERLNPRKNFMDICCAGYVLNDLYEFISLPEAEYKAEDIRILNRIFGLAKEISPANKVNALLKRVSADKAIPISAIDAYSVMGVLASCGVFDTPEHISYASGFIRCDEREFLYEMDIYYPLHFWRGKHGILYSAIETLFGNDISQELSEDQAIRGEAEQEEKKSFVSKAEQSFTDGVHVIDLDDRQRYYFGLAPMNPDWDRVVKYSVTHSTNKRSEIFFDGDRIKKLIYEEIAEGKGYTRYLESDMDVVTDKRQKILPLTSRGRAQNLTASILQTPTYMHAQLQVSLNCRWSGISSFNSRNDQQLPLTSKSLHTKEEFTQYAEEYIASCPPDYQLQLDAFIQRNRTKIDMSGGDIFRVQLTPTLYTYGLILGKVRQLETWPELPKGHPMRLVMTQPLMIRQYGLVTPNPQMTAEELKDIPLLDMQLAQDNEIRWATYPVVCHKKLAEDDIDLGFGINTRLKTIVWGLSMHTFDSEFWDKTPFENASNIGVCVNGMDHSVSLTYGVGMCISICYGDGIPGLIARKEDGIDEQKRTVIRILGLDEANAYDEFAIRYGGLTRKQYIELLEERK